MYVGQDASPLCFYSGTAQGEALVAGNSGPGG
jgi:hypothetical protein